MKTHDVKQGSPAWLALRRGIPTASSFDKVFTGAGKLSAQADAYMHKLIAELECPDQIEEDIINRAMERGARLENEARCFYEYETRRTVQVIGFCTTDDGRFGCSPDGLVGDLGGVEIKCPSPATHIGYCLKGTLPTEYRPQVHGSLWITGRTWWDFVSYCPGMPHLLVRVTPDEYTEKLGQELEKFHERFQEALAQIREGSRPNPLDTDVA